MIVDNEWKTASNYPYPCTGTDLSWQMSSYFIVCHCFFGLLQVSMNRKIRTAMRTTSAFLLILCSLFVSTSTTASSLPISNSFTVEHVLKSGLFKIGRTKRTLNLQEDRWYVFTSTTRASGMFVMFFNGKVIERSIWEHHEGCARSLIVMSIVNRIHYIGSQCFYCTCSCPYSQRCWRERRIAFHHSTVLCYHRWRSPNSYCNPFLSCSYRNEWSLYP